ncbi:MAG: ABC transporter permease [Candidatus Methylomirabilia bacterium]
MGVGTRRRLRPFRHVTFTIGFVVSVLLLLTAALSLAYTPWDPLGMSLADRLEGPSVIHWLGTDQYGRDLLSRVMTGAVTSIAVGVIAVGIGMGVGVVAIGIAFIPNFARLTRGSFLELREREFALAEAGLSYLGLGTQPPHPSWGLMLKEAQNFLSLNPWYAVFPGGAIAFTVLGLNLLGDGLRDLLDPRAR